MRKIFLLLLLLAFPLFAFADTAVSQLIITTDHQTIKPGVISAKITVQAQDSGGSSQNIADTAHLSLETTSATGEFSSSDTNWKAVTSLTMSKNTANRSFYYRDNAIGTYTITVRVTDGQGWTPATQTITVSDSALTPTPSDPPDSTPDASSTEPTPTSEPTVSGGGGSNYAVYSSSADLTATEAHPPKIGAGRNRLAVIGWPVKFSAVADSNASGSFKWSFGDGTTGDGNIVSHAYNFPGEYNVILNGSFSSGEAVARTKVRVVKPLVTIKSVNKNDGYLELENHETSEVNLNDWLVQNKTGSFKIPTDTIIGGQATLKIPLASTKLILSDQETLSLFYPNGRSAAAYNYLAQNIEGADAVVRQEKLQEIGALLKKLSYQVAQKVAADQPSDSPTTELASSNQPADQTDGDIASPVSTIVPAALSQAADVIVLDNRSAGRSKTQGWFGKTWQWVSGWWK